MRRPQKKRNAARNHHRNKSKKRISLQCLLYGVTVFVILLVMLWLGITWRLLSSSSASSEATSFDSTNNTTHLKPLLFQHQPQSLPYPPFYGNTTFHVPLRVPLPVIMVGLPKSGTTSLWHYFHCSGVVAQHYCCCGDVSDHPPCQNLTMAKCIIQNMRAGRPMLHECGLYQVYAQIDGERWTRRVRPKVWHVLLENGTNELVDNRVHRPVGYEMRHFLPQHFNLEQLHEEHPDATFVLPLRDDPQQWAFSVMNWFEMRGRVVNEYLAHNTSLTRPGKKGSLEFLAHVYQQHTDYIRRFVQQHTSHRLIEFGILHENASAILSDAFGLPPDCWQHKNKAGARAKFDTPEQAVTIHRKRRKRPH